MGVFIIAEMGVNHNGDINLAKRLIDAAADAGADAVKTQLFSAEKLVTRQAAKAAYQTDRDGGGGQFEMLRRLELSVDDYKELLDYAARRDILFFATPFDLDSVDALARLGCPLYKIPSGEVTNYPYLAKIGGLRKKVILSTGMCEMDDISSAARALREHGATDLTALHCNTQYPTPFRDANLLAIPALRAALGVPVGYSDHTPGIEAAIAAVALGAAVIEKHFTLDRTLPGPDHAASLEPNELAAMVSAIRNIELALGDGVKRVTDSERANVAAARKSLVAARPIKAGEAFTAENLTAKRPGGGVSPMRWEEALIATAKRDYAADEQIEI